MSANGERSSPLTRTTGVPQGSLPGPLFFSLFINDLPKYVKHCKFQLYADDFIIYLHGDPNKLTDVIYKINEDLASISRWASQNGLVINTSKSQALWVCSRAYLDLVDNANLPPITLNGATIYSGDSFKILGVTVDRILCWRCQCNRTASKCFGTLARLRRCHAFLTRDTKLMLVKSLIFPHLDYCAGVFLDLTDECERKLARCKNAALRFVTGIKIFYHITPIYREFEIITYAARRNFLAICLLAKILLSKTPAYLSANFKFIVTDELGRRRCSPYDLDIGHFRTEYRRYAFYIGTAYL